MGTAATAILAALLAPVSVVILGVLVSQFEQSGEAADSDWWAIMPWLLLAGVAAAVTAVANGIQRYCKSRLTDELGLYGHTQVLEAAAGLDLKTLEDRRTQNKLERANAAAGRNLLQFAEGLLKVVTSCLQVISLLGVLLWIEPFWTMVLLVLSAPAVLANSYLSSIKYELRRNKTTSRRWSRYYGKQFTQRELVASTKLLRLEQFLLGRHDDVMRDIVQANQRFFRLQAIVNALSTVFTIVMLLTAAFAVGRQVAAGNVSVGEFVAFWMAAWRLKTSLGNASTACSTVWESHLSIGETREFLDLTSEVKDRGTLQPSRIRGRVELRNVTFTYPHASRPTIEDVSLTIHEGETVAIVGHNGAGKTTLAKLLARLYQADRGQILLDGMPIEAYDLATLYQHFAFVFQQAARYEATAAENIAYGDWQRLLNQPDEIVRIARAARVDGMIEGLPNGYDTLLGRMFGDCDLSGGQWQKLSIARALACDPALVVLDEPAANLDVQSEHAMYQTVRDLIRDRTTILISHRFSTVGMADRIFVLDEGRLVEQGTHEQLLALGGTYAAMCRTHQATVSIKNRLFPSDLATSRMETMYEYESS
jgi:ATP-binding cassette subfamily B protein